MLREQFDGTGSEIKVHLFEDMHSARPRGIPGELRLEGRWQIVVTACWLNLPSSNTPNNLYFGSNNRNVLFAPCLLL